MSPFLANEPELKRVFGEIWAQFPDDPYKAGLRTFGGNIGHALHAMSNWVTDPFVIECRDNYASKNGEPKIKILSKEQLLKKIEDTLEALDPVTGRALVSVDDKIKAFKLYADIAGYIVKPDSNINLTKNVDNRVLVLVDHGSNGQWEESLQKQQRKLLSDARN